MSNNNCLLIDRSLPEIMKLKKRPSKNELLYLCWCLNDLGADLLEMDGTSLKALKVLPQGLKILYRILNEEDLLSFSESKFCGAVISLDQVLSKNYIKKLSKLDTEITVELETDYLPSPNTLNILQSLIATYPVIKRIRITGFEKVTSNEWMTPLNLLAKSLKVDIEVCALNSTFMATARGFEAYLGGAGAVTTTFLGMGGKSGYSAIEEIVAALEVLKGIKKGRNLNNLSLSTNNIQKMFGLNIPKNKPIVGSEIFQYESGIHADGISKDPATYEPYPPQNYGLNRKLVIGKHSGSKALALKLSELGLKYNSALLNKMLENVRLKAQNTQKPLTDQDIIHLYRVVL